MFSLDSLIEEAIKRNIALGIENRYYLNSIPDFEEMGLIFQKFECGNIGYWHDCGHAQAFQNFGLISHEKLLKTYADKLIGIHLHDCNGYNDHILPGNGEIDFDMIKMYLPENAIKIIEVQNGSYLEEDDIIRLADDFERRPNSIIHK